MAKKAKVKKPYKILQSVDALEEKYTHDFSNDSVNMLDKLNILNKMSFRDKQIVYRLMAGYSQSDISRQLGFTRAAISGVLS